MSIKGYLKINIALCLILGFSMNVKGQSLLDWSVLGYLEDEAIPGEVDTYFDNVNFDANPHHGFATSGGGVSGWLSQSFDDVGSSGITVTIKNSLNHTDDVLEGPSIYGVGAGSNPDCLVTGANALRINNDKEFPITPVTVIINFSAAVTIDEFIVGSLSVIGTDGFENIAVRAFTGVDGTGSTVAAAAYENISDYDSGVSLEHGMSDLACTATTNQLTNIMMAAPSANNTYHVMGFGLQDEGRYGRAKWEWSSPIRSIAVSTWITNTGSLIDPNYEYSYHSILISPISFSAATSFPVEWLEILAEQQGDDGVLSWTAIEKGNAYYVIERSVDSRIFEAIGQVDARGIQGSSQAYSFVDPLVAEVGLSVIQYRLKQVDFDGNVSYSPLIELNLERRFDQHVKLNLLPNPVSEKGHIYYETSSERQVQLEVFSIQGRRMMDAVLPASNGAGVHQLDVSGWAPGIYVIRLYNEEVATTRRMMVR